jgi:hypothetical protein
MPSKPDRCRGRLTGTSVDEDEFPAGLSLGEPADRGSGD